MFSMFNGFSFEGSEGGSVVFVGVGNCFGLSESTLVMSVIEEEGIIFHQGVNFGTFKGLRSPGINGLCNGFVSDKGKCRLADSCLCARGPFYKASIVSMFVMKIGDVIIDDRVDESIFDMGMGVSDPCLHVFRQLMELVVDDGAVSSLDVLAAGEENGFLLCLSDRYLTFFKAAETQLV